MGQRGPKPTPQSILKLRGSWRGKQRGDQPKLDQDKPQCPQWLITKQKTEDAEAVRAEAKRTWDRIVPHLWKAGLVTSLNRETLACLCDSWARYVFACRKCGGDSMVEETAPNGNLVQSPWVGIRNKMVDQVFKAAACYGLTPADLSGVKAADKPSESERKSAFFKREA